MQLYPKHASVLREREFESYPRALTDIMSLISMNPHDPAQVVGSFKFSRQEYPGDIDMSNEFIAKGDRQVALREIVASFQAIMQRLRQHREVHLSDFKCGYDERYNVNIGDYEVKRGKLVLSGYDTKNIKKQISTLYKNGLLTDHEHRLWMSLVYDQPSYKQFDALKQAIRTKYVLRWRMFEILRGYKKLPHGKTKTLSDAILQKSVVKLDVYAFVADRLIEITNFFILAYVDDSGRKSYLSDMKWILPKYLRENLEKEIRILRLPGMHKHVKLLKRLWLKARNHGDMVTMNRIQNFFDSGIGKLNQLEVDAQTMTNVIDKIKKPPFEAMDNILQTHKFKISSISKAVLTEEQRLKMFNYINQINPHNISKKRLHVLSEYAHSITDPLAQEFVRSLRQRK